jgi:hypothetical protein
VPCQFCPFLMSQALIPQNHTIMVLPEHVSAMPLTDGIVAQPVGGFSSSASLDPQGHAICSRQGPSVTRGVVNNGTSRGSHHILCST